MTPLPPPDQDQLLVQPPPPVPLTHELLEVWERQAHDALSAGFMAVTISPSHLLELIRRYRLLWEEPRHD